MTDNINAYYEGARLSEAAYADFTAAMNPNLNEGQKRTAIEAALTASGFSESMASDFVSKYDVAESAKIPLSSSLRADAIGVAI